MPIEPVQTPFFDKRTQRNAARAMVFIACLLTLTIAVESHWTIAANPPTGEPDEMAERHSNEVPIARGRSGLSLPAKSPVPVKIARWSTQRFAARTVSATRRAIHFKRTADWELTPEGEQALARGLDWLARNQGPEGNWESNDLGLVSMGALAFLAAGHTPGRGRYGLHCERAISYVLKHAQPSGLLNIADGQRDMYNHGLAAFVLGQAHGVSADPRLGPVLDRALKLIAATQCEDGGWDYHARAQQRGHDLSLAVMQAKALRSAVDSGLEVAPNVVEQALKSVRGYYRSRDGRTDPDDPEQRKSPGQFTYDGHRESLAMAACGVVCLQEFGEYDDWRIPRNMDVIQEETLKLQPTNRDGQVPFDAYALYYVGQAVYQVGDPYWSTCYPKLRNVIIANQYVREDDTERTGHWRDTRHLGGKPGELYGTAVACFVLSIPNRYLPILQEGRIDGLKGNE